MNNIIINENEVILQNSSCVDPYSFESENALNYLHSENSDDKILFIRLLFDDQKGEYSTSYLIDCYSRNVLKEILTDRTKGRLPCRMFKYLPDGRVESIPDSPNLISAYLDRFVDVYYRIDLSGGAFFYISKEDLTMMLASDKKIFYIDTNPSNLIIIPRTASKNTVINEQLYLQGKPFEENYLLSSSHCQVGSEISVAKVFACGGEGGICLNEVLDEINTRDLYRRLIALMLVDNLEDFTSFLENCINTPELREQIFSTYGDFTIDAPYSFNLLDVAMILFKYEFIEKIIEYSPQDFNYSLSNNILSQIIEDNDLISNELILQKLLYFYLYSLKRFLPDFTYQGILNNLIGIFRDELNIPILAQFLEDYYRTDEGVLQPQIQMMRDFQPEINI